MKTINTTIALLLISIASFATNITVKTNKEGVFAIQYKNTEKGNVRVYILNSKNQEIFSENFQNVSSFTRPYNFTQLAEGEYTIVIEDRNGKQTEKINYTRNKLVSYVHVSRVPNKENKFWLNVANNGTETLTVNIYSENGTRLHEQSVEVTGTLSMVYDLTKVKTAKTIVFEVVDGNNTIHTTSF